MTKKITFALAVMAAFAAHAATRTWNPTVKASNGRYNWTVEENWLDEAGDTGIPQTGDTVIIQKAQNLWLVQGTQLEALIMRPTSDISLSGTAPIFAVGTTGIRLETAKYINWYLALNAPANGELPVYVFDGGTVAATENVTGTSGRVLKQGPGKLIVGTKHRTQRTYNLHGMVIEAGTVQYGSSWFDMGLANHEIAFAGPTACLLLGTNQTFQSVNLYETNGLTVGSHRIDAASPWQAKFTGTPVRQPTVFTGCLTRKAGINWAPDSASSTFVFSNATSATEGTLTVTKGSVRLAGGATFAMLGALDVAADGTFEVESGSGGSFRVGAVTAASGATLSLGDGVVIQAAAASFGGNALTEGVYTEADNIGITGNGRLVVITPGSEPAAATWTGGGTTATVMDPANWGVETLPAISNGTLVATFASGGASALLGVDDVLNFGGWTLAGGFSFTAAEGAGLNYVGLSAGGMTAADAASATTYNLGWPLALAGTQQWTLGQNNTLNVNAPIAGAGSLTVNGKARVNFNTPSSYAGDVTLTNGTFYITATNAVGGPGGTLYFSIAYGTLHFAGDVAIDRPVTFPDTNDNNYKPFYIDANSTVDFNRKVYLPSKQRAISVEAGSVARFHGGLAASTCFRFSGSGTVVIDSEPLNMGDRFYAYGPTIELNVAYNRINGNVGNWSSGTIKTGVPYALCHKVPLGGDTYQRILLNGATIDLCGNDQSIGVLGGGSGKITSATPATFHLVDDYVNTETQFGSGRQTNNVPFEGCVSFAKEGSLNYWLKKVSPTYGDLSVTNGTLTVMSTASWANASNVTASCAGVLKVQNKNAFGRQAVVHIDGADARMLLDYSGSMKVYGLYIDGQKQPLGVYGGTASGAAKKLACFGDTGAGQLAVLGDGIGMTVIFR